MLSALPAALLLLLFASLVFAEPTSPYDPFRALSLQKPQQPENPICCLKPLTPLEPVDDGILLSFEEWKMKQLATQSGGTTPTHDKDVNAGAPKPGEGTPLNDAGSTNSESASPPVENPAPSGFNNPDQVPSGPHFRVPLTDRFNYASLDCSARVHTAHRSAKSPSSILSSKRDRYMLSPCDKSKESQYVVVELCDDIRIDTVQLANFEFFSGVFKDFTVSVAKNYDPEGWTPVATYRAKNVRGVQSFHPPTSLRDFYRFIRVDFISNYGNEFYCPVSLLRVYGLTHLEEWKWDVWELESRSKQEELKRKRQRGIESAGVPEPIIVPLASEPSINSSNGATPIAENVEKITTPPDTNDTERTVDTPSAALSQNQNSSDIPTSSQKSYRDSSTPTASEYHQPIPSHNANDDAFTQSTDSIVLTPIAFPIPAPSDVHRQTPHIPTPFSESSSTGTSLSSTPSQANINVPYIAPSPSESLHTVPGTPIIITSSTASSSAVVPVPPLSSHLTVKGGESIYRTIMNRLAEVELNQTLYVRYIEQQNLAVREAIKRLGEDVGRLEGISRAQSFTYQRTLADWERQRYQMEMEYGDLIARIEYLSEEIILEKRLGVAQLCLLLAVLIFLGLTRGSRAEAMIDHGSNRLNQSVREWGKRHLRLSGDWAGRFKGKNSVDTGKQNSRSRSRSRSTSRTRTPLLSSRPKPLSVKSYPPHLPLHLQDDDDMIVFPSTSRPHRTKEPLETIHLNTAPAFGEYQNRPRKISNPRSRAPSLRSTPAGRRNYVVHAKATTPTGATFRPQMLQRSSSHGIAMPQSGSWGSMNVPKSAKKWARTAHLHEVKTPRVLFPPASAASALAARRSKKSGDDISPTRHDRDQARTPREIESDRENEGFFSLAAKQVVNGKQPIIDPMPPPPNSILFAKTEDDGDPWVDSDTTSIDG